LNDGDGPAAMVVPVGGSGRGGRRTRTAPGRVGVGAGRHPDRFHRRRVQRQRATVPDRAGAGQRGGHRPDSGTEHGRNQDSGAAGQGDAGVLHAGGDTVERRERARGGARDRRE